jgi:diaminopimelate epimerase
MKHSQGVLLTRVSGAENTFFIADLFSAEGRAHMEGWSRERRAAFARKVCSSYFGFQTDGLLFLKPEKNYDFAWDFYNADGSAAEMCGNAARCAIVYFHEFIQKKDKVYFHTEAGDIDGKFLAPDRAQVEMTQITEVEPHLKLEEEDGFFVNTGVPHYVLLRPPQKDLARKLRFHPHFGKGGSNITFVEIVSTNKAKAVTFERGVEDFTQACGTGAVAAACLLSERMTADQRHESIHIQMPGGLLEIKEAAPQRRPLLRGPVRIEFKIEILGEPL